MITLYDAFFRGLKLFSRMVDKSRRYTSHYRFIDRSSGNENLLIIVAGYQQYLWEKVFDRISEYSDYDLDICVVVPGKDDNELKQICEGNNWSYLCTKENKLALAQNMAIKLHPSAEWIYKLDEDMFIGRGYFQGLKETYRKADVDGRYRVGVVSPLINVNGACYRWYLEKKGLVEEYEEKFAERTNTADDEVSALHGLFPFFKIIVFDALGERHVELEMLIVLLAVVNNLAVQGGADQADVVTVFEGGISQGGTHHSGADDCYSLCHVICWFC